MLAVRLGTSAVDVDLLAEAHYLPRLAASPATVIERGITVIVGQGLPPLDDVVVEIGSTGTALTAHTDEFGRFRVPFSPLGVLPLGSYVLRVGERPMVFDAVETQLLVVLSTFEPQGSSGPVVGTNVLVARGS